MAQLHLSSGACERLRNPADNDVLQSPIVVEIVATHPNNGSTVQIKDRSSTIASVVLSNNLQTTSHMCQCNTGPRNNLEDGAVIVVRNMIRLTDGYVGFGSGGEIPR